jgi:carboxylate-amine ligase
VAEARAILARGTSAHRQLATYRAALKDGADRTQALQAVVDMLIAGTLEGL